MTQMKPCTLSEAMYLLEICEEEQVKCGVEVHSLECNDYFVTIIDEVPKADYEESNDGDSLTIQFGNTQFTFDVPSQFAMDLDDNQIHISIVHKECIFWLLSHSISVAGISKAVGFMEGIAMATGEYTTV